MCERDPAGTSHSSTGNNPVKSSRETGSGSSSSSNSLQMKTRRRHQTANDVQACLESGQTDIWRRNCSGDRSPATEYLSHIQCTELKSPLSRPLFIKSPLHSFLINVFLHQVFSYVFIHILTHYYQEWSVLAEYNRTDK